MRSEYISIPLWARALSGIAALMSAAVLVWHVSQLAPADVSAKQIVFVAPAAATIFAAYVALVGKLAKPNQPKTACDQNN